MKTKAIYILGALAVLGACQAKEEWGENIEQIRLSLAGDIEQLAVTRASANAFADGDQVGIYAVNYDGDTPGTLALKGNQATNVRFTFDGTSAWTPDHDIYYKDKNTKVDIYGYYPYSSAISSVSEWPFEVQEDQSTVSAHGIMGGYEASDFLWAKRESVTPTANAIQLLFQHKMSCVVVTLEEGTGFEAGEFAALSKSVLIDNVKRNALINLSTGVVTATGAVPAHSTVPTGYEGGFRAIVVPQTVNSSLTLFSITLGGVPYTYSEGAAFTYVAGKQHNFDVTVDKKGDDGYAVSVSTSISTWTNDNSSHDFTAKEYVVVNVETPGTLGETLTAAGKDPFKIKYIKVLGTVNADDFYYIRDNMSAIQGINMSETVIVGGGIPDYAFCDKEFLTSFVFPSGQYENNITSIGNFAFGGTNLSGALVIPEGVTVIADRAFLATKISSISFPSTLEQIGERAFYECQYLSTAINLPASLRSIGSFAFADSSLSGNLYLPTNLQELGGFAFYHCNHLMGTLTIPNKITVIEENTFTGTGFTTLTLHDGITIIGNNAFSMGSLKGELSLPSNLIKIGDHAFSGAQLSGQLVLPESLISLGEGAFSGCSRLEGTVTIPSGITIIPADLFAGCSSILGLMIHSGVSNIGSNAFQGCYYLNSITCLSETPPYLGDSVFDGVAKDNFAVEVPESGIQDYINASGWSEFKRITAYRDFSISRRLYRTLNAEESKTFILRAPAGESWSIESKPNWVSVNPASGSGKTDVTVSVNSLTLSAGDREGNIVFLLDGKDYRCTLKVAQYDYTYGDGTVLTEQTHTSGSGIPLVFLGDCYDAKDIDTGSYLTDTRQAIDYFFDIEPYKTYRDYFDIYIVFGKSEDSGVGSVNTIREAKFGTQYSLTGGSLENNYTTAFQYAKLADGNMDIAKALIVMVLNSSDYGGITNMWNDGSAIAICPKSSDPYPYDFRGIVQHEAGGHGFGKLADEYIYSNGFVNTNCCSFPHLNEFLAGKANGWYQNLCETSDRNAVPWSHLIYHPSYSNTVDIYEGGFFHTRGIFRSEPNSCMNNNIPYYSAISRQAIVERIMDYSGGAFNLNDFYTNDAVAITKASVSAAPAWGGEPSNTQMLRHHEPILMGDHPEL